MTDEEYVRAVVCGNVYFSPPVSPDDSLDQRRHMRVAGMCVNVQGLGPPKSSEPWLVSLLTAHDLSPVARIHVAFDGVAQMMFPPGLLPAVAPYWFVLEPQRGYGELQLFVPVIRRGAQRTLTLSDPTDRLLVGLV